MSDKQFSLPVLTKAFLALATISLLASFGFFFGAIWSHGHDLPQRMTGTGFLLLVVSLGFGICAGLSFDEAKYNE